MSYTKPFVFLIVTGTLVLTACGRKQANTSGPVDVEVTLSEFKIESSLIEFKPDVQYRFFVTNKGVVPHEFMIMPVAMGGMGMSGMSMEEKDALGFMVITEEQLPPGATAEMDYTFTSVPEGNIEFVCALPGHFEVGMHTPITIE